MPVSAGLGLGSNFSAIGHAYSLTGLLEDYLNRHNLTLARHAVMDMSAVGWGYSCKQFKLSHKPWVAGISYGEWPYNKRNFTLHTITCMKQIHL